jgi:protoporphyrinogen oxidase
MSADANASRSAESAGLCRVGIVGGGMLGMTLALRLRERGCDVTLIEAGPTAGGLVQAQTIGGYTWDRFYHVTLLSDQHLHGLLRELGLGPLLRWGTTRTGFYTGGRLRSLSTSLEFLTFPVLSLSDKARLAATILRAARMRDWHPLEQVSVETWLRRWSGNRTFERIWLPLLKSKLGDNYRITSASFIWATIARMYAARRSGLKREMFGYVDGGYERVLREFGTRLESRGVTLRCGDPVAAVTDEGDSVRVRLAGGAEHTFDRVVLTVPCPRVVALCPQLTPAERARLGRVVYQGIVCASALLRRPLGGYYITNITDDGVPFTAVIEMTALVDRDRFGGQTLVYLPRYLTQDDAFWQASDAEVRSTFLAALGRMYPDLRPEDVTAFQVARVREMLALTTLDYSRSACPPIETSMPNVFIVNSAQIVNGTLNVNETVALANDGARRLEPMLRVSAAPVAA